MKNHNYVLEYERKQARKKKIIRLAILGLFLLLLGLLLVFFIYVQDYAHADEDAQQYLYGSDRVRVSEIPDGYFFDGNGSDSALIFYPGGKVEFTAYAPLMFDLAQGGVDCFLVEMPFNLAFFGRDKAAAIMRQYGYNNWYIGGHSLGGMVASEFVTERVSDSNTANDPRGMILLGSFPHGDVSGNQNLQVLSMYGSEDGVLDRKRYEEAKSLLPDNTVYYVIEGGNHAQFGDYGRQSGDGTATISKVDQWEETTTQILELVSE